MNDAIRTRWHDVLRVVDQALEQEPAVRAAFVERICSGDPVLRAGVERLLDAATQAGGAFLAQGAAADAAPLLSWVARQGLPAGTRFGAYELTGTLGRGGMATVYLAQDHKHHRQVAVKVLHAEVAAAVGREWFLREIEIAATLHHPHILPLHDSGAADDLLYYVMPHVEGESLRRRLVQQGPLPIDAAVRIVREVAGALDYAHRQGVVHRDIKPENILLQDGQAVVADFGIARAVAGGAVEPGATATLPAIGTPAYMSPEQAANTGPPDSRTDIYALGCVLYEMLAGVTPFSAPTARALLERHATDPVPSIRAVRPDVPVALEQAVARALAKSPGARFATAGEFVDAIDVAVISAEPRPLSGLRRRTLAVGLAAAGMLMAIGYVLANRPAAGAPDPGLVTILPFRTGGASPELAWLHEGMVDLLSIRLGGGGGLRIADPAAGIARRAGAGRVVEGSVAGTPAHLTITASLLSAGGRSSARADETGPLESLPALVDRLAARLLALDAGVESSRLVVTSASLPATRAFIAGRAAFRIGDFPAAAARFREATVLDSTFALAALELVHASVWVGGAWSEAGERGKRLAQAGRARLSSGDRALLDAWDVDDITIPQWIHGWETAARANPDRAEAWYELGDTYYHSGTLAGLNDPMRLASDAFQRGWAIDSANGADPLSPGHSVIVAEPVTHMVEIAQTRGDTASVRRLTALRIGVDSTSGDSWYLRWHRALALGDSALGAFWADSLVAVPSAWGQISEFVSWTGVGSRDLLRATGLSARLEEAGHPGEISAGHATAVLNGGRPREARRILHIDDADPGDLAARIQHALYWGGDTLAAADAARRLAPYAAFAMHPKQAGWRQLQPLCAVSAWRAAHGEYASLPAAIERLRTAGDTGAMNPVLVSQYAALCSSLLEATLAAARHRPDAGAALARADVAARTYGQWSSVAANLVVAHAAEVEGDLPLALRALRRRGGEFGQFPFYLSTFLREEGRVAALAGDTAGAIRAYRHYLALRPDPDPEARPEVERVQLTLARLVRAVGE